MLIAQEAYKLGCPVHIAYRLLKISFRLKSKSITYLAFLGGERRPQKRQVKDLRKWSV